jgi:hypothetical protein
MPVGEPSSSLGDFNDRTNDECVLGLYGNTSGNTVCNHADE